MTRHVSNRIYLAAMALLLLAAAAALFIIYGHPLWKPYYVALTGGRTLEQAIEQYGPEAEARLAPRFDDEGIMSYPPKSITLIAYKEEKTLQLWAASDQEQDTPRLIHTYPILAASGTAGPKLREGDRQVPEGLYHIESLNPNSSYHLSMKLNYPNDFDMHYARAEGRADNPGSNIFIHGKSASIGCLAMGDTAIEELFVLVHAVGLDNIQVIIAPNNPGHRPLQPPDNAPAWTAELYREIASALKPYAGSGQSP